ncbi:fumarylacetoacetate hydrolase family protein [Streptomyces sp. NPDC047829]|uniref:2-keto-4-pentenoate hydratase n=1 Tax=Streptomyces sp. NPDC047829 TaxID=3154609 RepID=UPI0033C268A8
MPPAQAPPASTDGAPMLSALHVFTTPGRLQNSWVDAVAAELAAAESAQRPVPRPSLHYPGLTLDRAYQVQAATVAERVLRGARVVGHKVGLTSAAMQQQIGVDQPDSGVLLDSMVLSSGSRLRRDELIQPRVEAEIAFRLGQPLSGSDVDADAARQAVAEVLLALEVIDTRYDDWRLTLEDSVADNAAAARAVLGTPVPLNTVPSLAEELVSVRVNGQTVAAAPGAAVLGNPLNAVAWLARRLHGIGGGLRAGDLVLAGSVHASLPLTPATHIEAASPSLPPVSLRVV